jgi:hypothetical protein
MEKFLNQCGLGAGSRQSEVIELALTHKFDAIEVDMADLVARYEAMGKQFAIQFFRSARVKIGTFRLPLNFGVSKEDFPKELARLDKVVELAKDLNCDRCYVEIEPGSEIHTFQDNFENHRTRLNSVGAKLAESNIKLGIGLADNANQCAKTYQFVRTAEECLTLLRLVGHSNVGLYLNSFNWVLGKGHVTHLAGIIDKITEVRLGDLPTGVANKLINTSQMQLPGSLPDSIAIPLMKLLGSVGYSGPISVVVGSAYFMGKPRDMVIGQIAQRLQLLIEVAEGKRTELDDSDEAAPELASV